MEYETTKIYLIKSGTNRTIVTFDYIMDLCLPVSFVVITVFIQQVIGGMGVCMYGLCVLRNRLF
jgi:hypothetical protein